MTLDIQSGPGAIPHQDVVVQEKHGEPKTLFGYIGTDRQLRPLHTLDEIRPSQTKVPDSVTGEARDRLIMEGRLKQLAYDAALFDLDTLEIDPSKRLGSGEFAFQVHARDMTDLTLHFPLFSPKYMSESEIRDQFTKLPPFRGARITGLRDKNGRELRGWVLFATFIPDQLVFAGKDELNKIKENVLRTSKLAYMLGADVIGLGAMTPALTHLGEAVKEHLPVHVTTGHALAAYMLKETLIEAAVRTEQDLRQSTIAVIGAGGAIARTAAHLTLPFAGRMILIDAERKAGKLYSFAESVQPEYPAARIECLPVAGTDDPKYGILKEADFVLCSFTSIVPFIRREWLKPGIVVVDDSMPVSIAKGEAEAVGGLTLHVAANTPGEFAWNFDFRLAPNSSFGCGAEVASLAAHHQWDQGVTGEIDIHDAERMATLAKATGFRLGPMQHFGELVTDEEFERVRKVKAGGR